MQFTKRILHSPLHILLIAVYPTLFLYLNNIDGLPKGIFIRPLIISCIFSILLFTLIFYSCKHINKSGIIASFLLILFFTYGQVYHLLLNREWHGWVLAGHKIGVTTYLAPLYLVGTLFGLYCFRKMRGNFTNSTIFFNITSLVLVGMTLFNILGYKNNIHGAVQPDIDITLKANDSKPDIYYIILDAYPRADILKHYYNHDNGPFINKLEALGFNVLEKSQSNYNLTQASIRSTLEMEYIDKIYSNYKDFLVDTKLNGLRYSSLLRILHNNGYKTNAFKTGCFETELNDSPYITTIFQKFIDYNRFEDVLLRSTPFISFFNIMPVANYFHRNRQLFILDTLPKFSKREGPNFIFAHLVCPHSPFVFDASGNWINWNPRNQDIFLLEENIDVNYFMSVKDLFADQVTYINNRLLQIVELIIKNSEREPVIIIQSDHSDRISCVLPNYNGSLQFYNLSAIYLPNGRQHEIPPDTSNINTFRYVFNYVFDTALPILPSKHYNHWSEKPLVSDFTNDHLK